MVTQPELAGRLDERPTPAADRPVPSGQVVGVADVLEQSRTDPDRSELSTLAARSPAGSGSVFAGPPTRGRLTAGAAGNSPGSQ